MNTSLVLVWFRGERLSTFCCVIGSGLTKYFLHLVGGSDWFFNILIWFTSHPDSEESLRLDSEKKSARAKVESHVNLRHSKTCDIWDPELMNKTNSQHEAKRKKFQNQDSVISEKFASKVNQTQQWKFAFWRKILCFITGRDPRSPGWLNIFNFHQSSGKNILSLLNLYMI